MARCLPPKISVCALQRAVSTGRNGYRPCTRATRRWRRRHGKSFRAVLKLSRKENAQSRQKKTQALVVNTKIGLFLYIGFFAPETLEEPLNQITHL